MSAGDISEDLRGHPGDAVGLYLLGWLIFTFYMTIAALRTNVGLRFVRNWMGYHANPADFVQPRQAPGGGGDLPAVEWT